MNPNRDNLLTIVIVDDNQDLLDLLCMGLCDDYIIVTAQNGEEGLSKISSVQPACAIIDIMMPSIDGFQIIRTLRGDAATASIPLIILTALTIEEGQFPGLASGADRFLTKPVTPSELRLVINEVLTISQSEREARYRQIASEQEQ
jgi:DNA-binding response OmpR family regulator